MTAHPLLAPAGWLYGHVTDLRNFLYDRKFFAATDLGRKTISVGNITAGGTGKTPVVAKIAQMLLDKGERVCILTRGYGRATPHERVLVADDNSIVADPVSAGDEPFELAEKLDGKAVMIADADRVAAAKWAVERYDISVFLLDDGFQHRRVERNIDIVLIDLTVPFGGRMLPSGKLREPLHNLSRADAIILTRSDLADSETETIDVVRKYNKTAQIFTSQNSVTKISRISGADEHIHEPLFAFCGIGNPDNFFKMLRNEGLKIAGTRKFRDHYRYTKSDVDSLVKKAAAAGAGALITTHKDSVKLIDIAPENVPVYVVEIEPVIEPFDGLLDLIFGNI
jgi:tetraacyldisaccharide 4'-kinase